MNPSMTVGNQIGEPISLHIEKDKNKIRKKVLELLQFIRITPPEERIDSYPYSFSGGMLQRSLVAMGISGHPEVLIADEPTKGIDIMNKQAITYLLRVLREEGITLIIITHALKNALLPVIIYMGTQFGWIFGGAVTIETIFALPGLGRLLVNSVSSMDIMTMKTLSLLLAPFIPFFAEELYSRFSDESVHTQAWPTVDESFINEEAEAAGELIKEITGEVRRYKSELGMALNAPLKKLEIYNANIDTGDIAGATNSKVELMEGAPSFEYVPVDVKPNMGILGPRFRKDAGAVVKALKAESPVAIEAQAASGKITVSVDGKPIELEPEAVEIRKEVISGGREVDVLEVRGAVVVIVR